MLIKMKRNTIVEGVHRGEGEKVEVGKKAGEYLCAIGKAAKVEPIKEIEKEEPKDKKDK